jgi:DNA-3-methyladenine glycosylase
VVAPDLIGCLLVKRQANGELLSGVVVETEAYCQSEPACHGYRRRSPSNETLFGEPGRFYVYVSYGIHHCVKAACLKGTSAAAWIVRVSAGPKANAQAASQGFPRFFLPSDAQGYIGLRNGLRGLVAAMSRP